MVLEVKNLPANEGDIRDVGSIPGSGRFPGEGHDNSVQYSCLENSMDRGAWRATLHRVANIYMYLGFPLGSVVKESPCNEGDLGSMPG